MGWVPRWHKWPNGPFTLNQASRQALGLVGWWPTVGYRSGDLANYVGRNPAVANGITPMAANEELGPMVHFDGSGSSDFIITKTPLEAVTGPFSVSFWIKTENITQADGYGIIGSGVFWPHTQTNWLFAKMASNFMVDFKVGDGVTDSFFVVEANLGYGVTTGLYHIVGIHDPNASVSGGLYSWVNGAKSDRWDGPTLPLNQSESEITVGYAMGNPWLGEIGDIRFYNHALSDNEVWALYDPTTRWELYAPLYRVWAIKAPAGGATGALAANLTATSTLQGALAGRGTLAGRIVATSTLTATLTGKEYLTARVVATSTLQGSLTGRGALAGRLVATSTLAGALTGRGALAAQCVATSTLTGTLTSLSSYSNIAARLVATSTLAGALTGYTTYSDIAARLVAAATQQAALSGYGALSGAPVATSTLFGNLTALGSGSIAARLVATSTQQATLAGNLALSGRLVALATQQAALTGKGALTAALTALSSVTGTLQGNGALTGRLVGATTQQGTLTGSGALAVRMVALSTCTGTLTSYGSGALAAQLFATATLSATLTDVNLAVVTVALMVGARAYGTHVPPRDSQLSVKARSVALTMEGRT